MPLQLEPIMLLTAVPGELVAAVAVPIGGAFAAMAKGMTTLYNNSRTDSIASISALKDATHALSIQSATIEKQGAAIEKLTELIQKDGYRRASGG